MKKLLLIVLLSTSLAGSLFATPNEDLIEALKKDDPAGVEKALTAGADVNLRFKIKKNDLTTTTPLALASGKGSVAMVKKLISFHANVNEFSDDSTYGEPPLTDAVTQGHLEIVKILIEAGANVNAQDKYRGFTALMQAIQSFGLGWVDWNTTSKIVDELIAAKTNVNLRTEGGASALGFASFRGYLKKDQSTPFPPMTQQLIAKLIAAGAKEGLIEAASSGNLAAVEKAIAAGEDVNSATKYGDTALIYACAFGHLEIVKFLIKHGANVNAQNEKGFTPLINAIQFFFSNGQSGWGFDSNLASKIVDELIAAKANVNLETKEGKTALGYARSGNYPGAKPLPGTQQLIAKLIAAGAK
jgi:ankyrin repeat protein